MELIEQLSRHRPLREISELYLPWTDVGAFKKFICCFKSELMLSVEVQFSCMEEEQKDVMFKYLLGGMSGIYKYAQDHIKLKYCRLKITNKTGAECNELNLYFYAVDRYHLPSKVTFSEPVVTAPRSLGLGVFETAPLATQPESPKNRFKSPFKKDRPKSNLSEAPKPRPPPLKDCRVPDSLPECVLVGQKGGSYKHLRGMPDQYLKMGRDGLEFAFIYPVDSMDTSQWNLKE